jgi:hypothetical protein
MNKRILLCPLHHRPMPCLSCRGIKGGSVSSPKKSAANRKKARKAALARWRGKKTSDARLFT